MDSYLIDYVRSGEAWVLVGSGPSNAMNYPSWMKLAEAAVAYYENSHPVDGSLRSLLAGSNPDYPAVFQRVADALTMPVLLRELRAVMAASRRGASEIYETLAAWPVPVYLTTNYDDQMQISLAAIGEAYVPYGNSPEHMALLDERLGGAVLKLHGDLRSEAGLILTTSQYENIHQGADFVYWRERMKAVLQMRSMVIIGHSLSDPNIKHVLEIAKIASGVERPVCWIADDVNADLARRYLNDYRIRVVGYANATGTHEGLLPLLKTVSRFVPPRSRVVLTDRNAGAAEPSRAASALHVFNRLGDCTGGAVDRIKVVAAAIMGAYTKLRQMEPFSLDDALLALGWPAAIPREEELTDAIKADLTEQGLLETSADGLRTTEHGLRTIESSQTQYRHALERFATSIKLRISACPISGSISAADVDTLPLAIERSLSQYFDGAGVSFASMLHEGRTGDFALPQCILEHVRAASTQFDDFRSRQVFCIVTLDMFCEPRGAEKEYIGRISDGFFAFHSLGVFGDVGNERRRQLAETVWILDSNVLIHLLSDGYVPGLGTRRCVAWLAEQGIQLFATEALFEELRRHLGFAFYVVRDFGEESTDVMAAALGNSPYNRSNAFLQGFLESKAAGKCGTWENYCTTTLGSGTGQRDAVKARLEKLGVQVIHFSDWPGFDTIRHYRQQREYEERIVERILGTLYDAMDNDEIVPAGMRRAPRDKAKPESEALVLVERERDRRLDIGGRGGRRGAAWFVSDTSVLNAIFDGGRATWPSVAFERHVSALMRGQAAEDIAFSSIVQTITQSGYAVIATDAVEKAFGHLIDESSLSITQERATLDENLGQKYAEPVESVMQRLAPVNRPLAASQLKAEALQQEARRREVAEDRRKAAEKELADSKRELAGVSKYVRKQAAKREQQAKARKRKQQSGRKKSSKKHKR